MYMSNYLGVRCPVCNKKFTEADDIVVCPVCGAPHHRDCYMEKGQCVFSDDHLSGKEWQDPAAQTAPPPHSPHEGQQQAKVCSRCGSSNPPEQIFCQVCGNPLAVQQQGGASWGPPVYQQVDSISMAYGGLSPDEEIDGETVRDIAMYIGNGSAYYLPRFRLMSQGHRVVSPNFSAFLFSFCYFFYRKMYLIGGILFVLSLVGSIPSYLYTFEVFPEVMAQWGFTSFGTVDLVSADRFLRMNNVAQTLNIIIRLITCFCANRFYYNRVVSAVHKIRTGEGAGKTSQEYGQILSQRGGTSKAAVAIVLAVLLVIQMAISYMIVYTWLTL